MRTGFSRERRRVIAKTKIRLNSSPKEYDCGVSVFEIENNEVTGRIRGNWEFLSKVQYLRFTNS